jgi:hypothetical protein
LSDFDVDVVLLTLAPELDRRYERLYAYLQDNVHLRRPSVDLALHLLCSDAGERLERLQQFSNTSPLIGHGLIRLTSDADEGPLLASSLKLEEQVVAFLLGEDVLDGRLAPHCREHPDGRGLGDLPLTAETKAALTRLAQEACAVCNPVRLYFLGPERSGREQAAAGLASQLGRDLLVLDLASAVRTGEVNRPLQLFAQAARLRRAIPCLANVDVLADDGLRGMVAPLLAAPWDILILLGQRPDLPLVEAMIEVPFGLLAFPEARTHWRDRLAASAIHLTDGDIEELAAQLRLTAGEIDQAIRRARLESEWRRAASDRTDGPLVHHEVTTSDLFEAACQQSTAELATLARRQRRDHEWVDIVLPDDALFQLRELCARVGQRRRVLDEWGFGRRLSLGRGTVALFTGPSGTGKTLAAEIVASELRLDLCKIDLSSVVSKYIGETEKNLERIFAAAERANAILFFDEADALFGKRSEVRDSHDRYANIETSYLLQKMEEYDGMAILATNLRQNLDESFIRRIAFTIHFPFPDEASRAAIWRNVWPPELPIAKDVDPDLLGRTFKLAGGNIKNIALAAAFLAAEAGSDVSMVHLIHATRREYQKLGKVLSEAELTAVTSVSAQG